MCLNYIEVGPTPHFTVPVITPFRSNHSHLLPFSPPWGRRWSNSSAKCRVTSLSRAIGSDPCLRDSSYCFPQRHHRPDKRDSSGRRKRYLYVTTYLLRQVRLPLLHRSGRKTLIDVIASSVVDRAGVSGEAPEEMDPRDRKITWTVNSLFIQFLIRWVFSKPGQNFKKHFFVPQTPPRQIFFCTPSPHDTLHGVHRAFSCETLRWRENIPLEFSSLSIDLFRPSMKASEEIVVGKSDLNCR